jgi:hypothetical protein
MLRGRAAMSDDLKTFSLELVAHAGKPLWNGLICIRARSNE